MTDLGFAPKEVIPQQVCRLEVLAADKAETYGLQIGLKLMVIGGKHDGHIFTDYANRDENTGQVKQGSKAWSIFEACLGCDFHKQPGVSLKSLVVSSSWLRSRRREPGVGTRSSLGPWVLYRRRRRNRRSSLTATTATV